MPVICHDPIPSPRFDALFAQVQKTPRSRAVTTSSSPFRPVPRTGVIFVTTEAERCGFFKEPDQWCNLGQGQPETGELPGAPERLTALPMPEESYEYAPVSGLWDLREAVADMYNRRFRRGMPSQYSAENVAISAGGRLGLARVAVALGDVHLGHFLPDYTAYEELLDVFKVITPIPLLLDGDRRYRFSVEELEERTLGLGLSALLFSNPCNPTGKTLMGAELARWVEKSRELDLALIIDEFYSHYIWAQPNGAPQAMVSAAEFVKDVNADPVILIDGLTKNWRYPGLRISWTVGPKHVIDAAISAGSFLDGGACRPAQAAAVKLLSPDVVEAETTAIRNSFRKKRELLLSRLIAMGIDVELPPEGGFYVWGKVDGLPPGLNTDMDFFQAALAEKVITVPGHFFDIDPGHRRHHLRPSRFSRHLRFSFGPSYEVIERACDRLSAMIEKVRGA
jgi:aspartate/methionine/tyrosine aminotransferase